MSEGRSSSRRWWLLLLLLTLPLLAGHRGGLGRTRAEPVATDLAISEEAPQFGVLASDSLFAAADAAARHPAPPAATHPLPTVPNPAPLAGRRPTASAPHQAPAADRPAKASTRTTDRTDRGTTYAAPVAAETARTGSPMAMPRGTPTGPLASDSSTGTMDRLLRGVSETVERAARFVGLSDTVPPAPAAPAVPAARPVAAPTPVRPAKGDSLKRKPAAPAEPAPIGSLANAEPVLTELQLGRLANRTVAAYRSGDDALIPLSVFFELAEIRSSRRADGAVEAMVQPGNVPLLLEPASHLLKLGKQKIVLGDDQLVSNGSDVYLATKVLARAFGLDWEVSWPDLQVTVLEPGSLPVARRIRRESLLRAQLQRSTTAEYTGLRLGLDRSRLNGLVVDYSVLTPTNGFDAGAYSTTLGLDLFGGSLALGVQSQNGTNKPPRTEASWTGIWRDNPRISQLQLGDGISTGPRSRTLRGFSVSNSPYVRPSVLGNIPFSGQLGTGWSVEAYRGGRLIGFDSVNALGQYSFDVPIEYGENPVDFIAYGPFGEVREFNQTYRLRTEGLPAHRFEYGVSAGECRTSRCSASGNVDLRYGISTRWTARAGIDQFWRQSSGDLSHPYVGLLGTLTNSIAVEGEAVGNAVLRGAVRYEPSVDVQLTAEAHRFARGVNDPILTPDGRLNQLTLTAMVRPVSRLGGTFVEASLDRVHAEGSDITSSRVGASLQAANIRFSPAVRMEHQQTIGGPAQNQTVFSLNTFILSHPELGPVLGSVTGRTSLDVTKGVGPVSASAFVGRPILRNLRAETGATWYKGSKGPTFSLLIAAELPTVRSYTTMQAGGGQPAMGTQYVTGSAIYNPSSSSVNFTGSPGLSRGGVTGRVFLDANGNGKFDADEQPLPDVRIVVGPTFAFSDSSGEYHVWDVLPYEPTQVTVDSSSLSSPLWAPAFAAITVEPSPNRYRRIDIPVLQGGVIEGRVAWPGRERTGGIALVMTHRKSGERRLLTTFGDGTFYAIGVRPGDWELAVDSKCLELLQVSAAPVRFTLAASADGATVSNLEIVLK